MIQIATYLKENAIKYHQNQGITIIPVQSAADGVDAAQKLLYGLVDKKTVVYLSGGKTPETLLTRLAAEEIFEPGAVGMIDERFGTKFHPKSNETMFRQTGILRYLELKNIPFYPVITPIQQTREMAADAYDQKVRELHATFQVSLGLLGIGADGHTSSLAPNRDTFDNPMFAKERAHLLVSEFNDPKSMYGERVGMTILGLTMLDLLVVLVFGEDKKKALTALFEEGSEEAIPARLFKRPAIAKKTLFITDQNV